MSQLELMAAEVKLNEMGIHGGMVIANTRPRTPLNMEKFVEIDVMTDTVFTTLEGNLNFTGVEKAVGTITVVTVPANSETVTIGTRVYEFTTDGSVTAGRVAVDISVEEEAPEITIQEVATLLGAAINGDASRVANATVSGAVVSLEAVTAGTDGNALDLLDGTTGNVTVSAATLLYGAAAKTIKAGTKIKGIFTEIELASGTVIAYEGK